jgi:uncharacterized OsmC-like protein
MTVRTFADNSKWPLEGVTCRVREHVRPGEHVPQGIELELRLVGPLLTQAQRERLLRAANSCPVHNMFCGGMVDGIKTSLEGL